MNKKANELLQSYGFDKIKAGDMIDDYNFEDRKLVEIVKATYSMRRQLLFRRKDVKNCTNR